MVLADWLEEAFERRSRRRKAEAWAKGRAEVNRVWGAWLARLEEAKEQGRPFTEPPPVIAGLETEPGAPMKICYSQQADSLRIILREVPVAASYEPVAGLILDFDEEDEVVAIQVLDASRKTNLEVAIDIS